MKVWENSEKATIILRTIWSIIFLLAGGGFLYALWLNLRLEIPFIVLNSIQLAKTIRSWKRYLTFKKNVNKGNFFIDNFNDFLSALNEYEHPVFASKFLADIRKRQLLRGTHEIVNSLAEFCVRFEKTTVERTDTIISLKLPRGYKREEIAPRTPEEWEKYHAKVKYHQMESISNNPFTSTSFYILQPIVLEELTLLLDQVRANTKINAE